MPLKQMPTPDPQVLGNNNLPVKKGETPLKQMPIPATGVFNTSPSSTQYAVDLSKYTDYIKDVFPDQDINEQRAQAQTKLERWGHAAPRLVSKFATEVGKIPGFLGGGIGFLTSGDYTVKSFADYIDNGWIQTLDNLNEDVKERFDIYTPKSVREGSLWDNISSASFWTNEGVDGAGFLLAALVPGGALKALGAGSKIARLFGSTAKVANNIDLGLATGINTFYEAGSEALQLKQELDNTFKGLVERGEINPKTGKPWTKEEADQTIGEATRNSFIANFIILLGPNLIMNRNILGPFNTTKSALSKIFDPATGKAIEVADRATKKQLIGTVGKAMGINTFSEGLWEEGSQNAVQNYYKALALNEENIDKNHLTGLANEYLDTLQTTDGQKAIFLGALFGSMAGGIGGVREKTQEAKQLSGLQELINNTLQSYSSSMTDIYKKDELGKVITDENGPVIDMVKVLKSFEVYAQTQSRRALKDIYAIKGDKEGFDFIRNEEFADFVYPYLAQEGGIKLLDKHIDTLADKLVEELKIINGAATEEDLKQTLKAKARELQAIYNKAELYGPEYSNLSYDKKDKETAMKFLNRLKFTMVNEASRQSFFTERIEKLNVDLLKLTSDNELDNKERERITKQIESYKKLLSDSKEAYKDLFDTKKQQSAFNAILKHEKDKEALIKETEAKEEVKGIAETKEISDFYAANKANQIREVIYEGQVLKKLRFDILKDGGNNPNVLVDVSTGKRYKTADIIPYIKQENIFTPEDVELKTREKVINNIIKKIDNVNNEMQKSIEKEQKRIKEIKPGVEKQIKELERLIDKLKTGKATEVTYSGYKNKEGTIIRLKTSSVEELQQRIKNLRTNQSKSIALYEATIEAKKERIASNLKLKEVLLKRLEKIKQENKTLSLEELIKEYEDLAKTVATFDGEGQKLIDELAAQKEKEIEEFKEKGFAYQKYRAFLDSLMDLNQLLPTTLISWNGKEGYITTDTFTGIKRFVDKVTKDRTTLPKNKNNNYEGKIAEFGITEIPGERPISPIASVIETKTENGKMTISISGSVFQNTFDNPLNAIFKDENGNIEFILLKDEKGKRVEITEGAEEIAYAIHLEIYNTLNDEDNKKESRQLAREITSEPTRQKFTRADQDIESRNKEESQKLNDHLAKLQASLENIKKGETVKAELELAKKAMELEIANVQRSYLAQEIEINREDEIIKKGLSLAQKEEDEYPESPELEDSDAHEIRGTKARDILSPLSGATVINTKNVTNKFTRAWALFTNQFVPSEEYTLRAVSKNYIPAELEDKLDFASDKDIKLVVYKEGKPVIQSTTIGDTTEDIVVQASMSEGFDEEELKNIVNDPKGTRPFKGKAIHTNLSGKTFPQLVVLNNEHKALREKILKGEKVEYKITGKSGGILNNASIGSIMGRIVNHSDEFLNVDLKVLVDDTEIIQNQSITVRKKGFTVIGYNGHIIPVHLATLSEILGPDGLTGVDAVMDLIDKALNSETPEEHIKEIKKVIKWGSNAEVDNKGGTHKKYIYEINAKKFYDGTKRVYFQPKGKPKAWYVYDDPTVQAELREFLGKKFINVNKKLLKEDNDKKGVQFKDPISSFFFKTPQMFSSYKHFLFTTRSMGKTPIEVFLGPSKAIQFHNIYLKVGEKIDSSKPALPVSSPKEKEAAQTPEEIKGLNQIFPETIPPESVVMFKSKKTGTTFRGNVEKGQLTALINEQTGASSANIEPINHGLSIKEYGNINQQYEIYLILDRSKMSSEKPSTETKPEKPEGYDDDFYGGNTKLFANEAPMSKAQRNKEIAMLKRAFPMFKDRVMTSDELDILHNLISTSSGSAVAMLTQQGKVLITDLAAEGDVYHEAWHITSMYMLSSKERKEIYDEWRTKNKSSLSDDAVEEEVAEELRSWMRDKTIPSTMLGRLFQRILDWFNGLFNTSKMEKVFRQVRRGKFRNRKITNFDIGRDYTKLSKKTVTETEEIMATVSALFFNEVLRVSKNNISSIFKTDIENIKNIYENVRKNIAYTKATKIDPHLTEEIKNNYQYLLDNWKEIVDTHIDYIKRYGFDIEAYAENDKDADSIDAPNDSIMYIESVERSTKDSLTANVKLLLASLPEMELQLNKEGTGYIAVPKLNENYKLPTAAEFSKTIDLLQNRLHGTTNITEQVKIIEGLIPLKPELLLLLKRLKLPVSNTLTLDKKLINVSSDPTEQKYWTSLNLTLSEKKIENEFVQQMSKTKINSEVLLLDVGTNDIYFANSISTGLDNLIRERWAVNQKGLFNSPDSMYYKNNNLLQLNKGKFENYLKTIGLLDKDGKFYAIQDFQKDLMALEKLGIEFSNKHIPFTSNEKTEIRQALIKIYTYIIKNPNEYVDDIIKANKINEREGINQTIKILTDIELARNTEESELQSKSASNKTVYGLSLNSYFSIIIDELHKNGYKNLEFLNNFYNEHSIFRKILTKDPKAISKVMLAGMRVNESGEKGEDVFNLTEPDLVVNTVNAILSWRFPILQADRKLQYATKIDFSAELEAGAVKILQGHLEDELMAIYKYTKEDVGKGIIYYDKNRPDLGIFDFLNIPESKLKDLTISDVKSIPYGEDITKQLENYLEERTQKTVEKLINNELVIPLNNTYKNKGLDKKVVRAITGSENYINEPNLYLIAKTIAERSLIANIENNKMFMGDLSFYKDVIDAPKRSHGLTSTRKMILADAANLAWMELNLKSKYRDKRYSNYRYYTFAESKVVASEFVAFLNKKLKELYPDASAKQIAGVTATYKKLVEEADGLGWQTIVSYRDMRHMSSTWTDKHEKAFRKIEQQIEILLDKQPGDKIDLSTFPKLNEQEMYYFTSTKPQGFGPDMLQDELYSPTFLKCSFHTLLPEMLIDENGTVRQLNVLHTAMIKNNIDFSVMQSGHKVGMKGMSKTLYNSKGNISIPEKYFHNEGAWKFIGVQLDINEGIKDSLTFGTQMRQLILSNLVKYKKDKNGNIVPNTIRIWNKTLKAYENIEVPTLIKNWNSTINKIIHYKRKELIKRLSINKEFSTDGVNYKITDYNKFRDILISEARSRNVPLNIIDGINQALDELNPHKLIDILPNKTKLENILMSIIENSVIKQKIKGDMMVQASNLGYEVGPRKITKSDEQNAEWLNVNHQTLRAYHEGEKDEEGRIMPCQILINRAYYPQFKGKSAKEINIALRELVGYRIPTDGLKAIEAFEVVGFLPEESAATIVFPTEVVTKSGTDFDIDKQNIFIPHFYTTKNGEIVPFTKEETHEEYLLRNTDIGVDVITDPELYENLQNENELIFIAHKLLLSPDKLLELVTPSSMDKLKSLRDQILEQKKQTNKSLRKLIEWDELVDLNVQYWAGKAAVGIAANHNKSHIVFQLADIQIIDEDFIDNFGFKFSNMNAEKTKISLSEIYDADKEPSMISELLGQFVNAATDNAKELILAIINAGTNTLNTWLSLVRMGVPYEAIGFFMTQPIITEYLKLQKLNEAVFKGAEYGSYQKSTETLIKEAKENIALQNGFANHSFDVEGTKRITYSTNDLKDLFKMSKTERYQNAKYVDMQAKILDDYMRYQEMSKNIRSLMQAVSQDTKGAGKDRNQAKSSIERLEEIKAKNVFENIDNIINSELEDETDPASPSFIQGFYNTVKETPKMLGALFLTEQPVIENFLRDMFRRNYKDINMSAERESVIRSQIENDFITYVLLTQINDKTALSNEAEKLFTGDNSLPIRFSKFSENPTYKNNTAVRNLFPTIFKLRDKENDLALTDKLRLFSSRMSQFTNDDIVEGFRELKNVDEELYKDVIKFGIIQCGLSQTQLSYLTVIPTEDYQEIAKNTISKLLQNTLLIREDIEPFEDQFFRNNYYIEDIVPVVKFNRLMGELESENPKKWLLITNKKQLDATTTAMYKANGFSTKEHLLFKYINGQYVQMSLLGNKRDMKEYYKLPNQKSFLKANHIKSKERLVYGTENIRPNFDKLPSVSPIKTMTYAGIGSRETPPKILAQMTEVAKELEAKGYTLNTGVTFNGKEEGADKAFSDGATKKNLFSPEKQGSRNREQTIAKEIHPNPQALGDGGLKLMARNTNQVFGDNLDTPVDFVLFYAEETSNPLRPKGGTGQAVEMARRKDIPTINMANPNWKEQLNKILNTPTIGNIPPISTSSNTTVNTNSDNTNKQTLEEVFATNDLINKIAHKALKYDDITNTEDYEITKAYYKARNTELSRLIRSNHYNDKELNIPATLKDIIRTSNNPLYVELAKKFLENKSIEGVKAYYTNKEFEVKTAQGLYQLENNKILIFLSNFKTPVSPNQLHRVILHEIVHYFVDKELVLANSPLAKNIAELYEYTKEILTAQGKGNLYGLTNVHEFITETLTNPVFQEELSKIKAPEKFRNNKGSLLDYFIKLISDLFGVSNSVLEAVIFQSGKIIETQEIKHVKDVNLQRKQTAFELYEAYAKENPNIKRGSKEDIVKFYEYTRTSKWTDLISFSQNNDTNEDFNNSIKEGFFKDFNVSVEEYDSIKEALGYDSSQMVDLVTKFVAINKGEKLDKATAFFAYSLLGKENSKIRSELKYRIYSWEKYKSLFEKYKKELANKKGFIEDKAKWKNLIRDKIIIDYLSETIVEYYNNPSEFEEIQSKKWTKEDFTFISKLLRAIKKLLAELGIIENGSKEKLNNTAKNIAHDILNREYKIYNYKLDETQIRKTYSETIEKDQFAKALVEFAQNNGLVLTGSLALRRAGTVYRTMEESLHDIDFVVPYELNTKEENAKVYHNITRFQGIDYDHAAAMAINYIEDFTWFKALKEKYPTLQIINGFYGKEHAKYESFTLTTVIDGQFYTEAGTHEENGKKVKHKKGDYIKNTGYILDFFVRLQPNQEEHENYFKLWKEIMIAKIVMGRAKDFTDYKEFVPYLKSKASYNFYHPDYVFIERGSDTTTQKQNIKVPNGITASEEEEFINANQKENSKFVQQQRFFYKRIEDLKRKAKFYGKDHPEYNKIMSEALTLQTIIEQAVGLQDRTLLDQYAKVFLQNAAEYIESLKEKGAKITDAQINYTLSILNAWKQDKVFANTAIDLLEKIQPYVDTLSLHYIKKVFGDDVTIDMVNAQRKDFRTFNTNFGSLSDSNNYISATIGTLIKIAQDEISNKNKKVKEEIDAEVKKLATWAKERGKSLEEVYKLFIQEHEIVNTDKENKKYKKVTTRLTQPNDKNGVPNPNYQTIMSNPVLKNFYDFYNKTIKEASNKFPNEIEDGFIANIRKKGWKESFKQLNPQKERIVIENPIDQEYINTKVPIMFLEPLPPSEKSEDLGDSLLEFVKHSNTYDKMHVLLPTLRVLQNQIYNTTYINPGNSTVSVTHDKSNIWKMVDKYIEMQVLGVMKLPNQGKWFNKKKAIKDEEGKYIHTVESYVDMVQIADNFLHWNSLLRIGLSPSTALTNIVFGESSNLIEAIGGRYFNLSQLASATKIYWSQTFDGNSFLNKMLKEIPILQELDDYQTVETGENIKMLSKEKLEEYMYSMQKGGEKLLQARTALAIMIKQGYIKDGKPTKKYIDAVNNKASGELYKLTEHIIRVNQMIHGRYSQREAAILQQNVIFRIAMQFRKWLPAAIENRFGGYVEKDLRLGTDFEGRYITFAKLLRDLFDAQSLLRTKGLQGLTELQRYNMRKNLAELGLLFVLTAAYAMMHGGDDDKEWRKYTAVKFGLTLLNRATTDLSQFINPGQTIDLVKNTIPALKLVEDLTKMATVYLPSAVGLGESPEFERGSRKGMNKFWTTAGNVTPVIKPILDIKRMSNDEQLEELRKSIFN